MDARVKTMWLEALRSGEYKQAQGYLNIAGGYCCLGILCDLASKEIDLRVEQRGSENMPVTAYNDFTGLPPTEVRQWAGLAFSNPKVGEKRVAELNDGGMSFSELADLIEVHL